MSRPSAPYRLWDRGGVFYYKLRGWKSWRSTGLTTKSAAIDFCVARCGETRYDAPQPMKASTTLKQYLAPFYIWGEWPHCRRLLDERKQIERSHVEHSRRLIEQKILTHPIASRQVLSLRRRDILDFRSDLLKKHNPRTVNGVIQTLKTCLKEGVFREDLPKDPTLGVGNIRYKPKESGTFTAEELKDLFKENPGPWGDEIGYTLFLTLATTGLRRGEALALTWRAVDFDARTIAVEQALKDQVGTVGKPKWSKLRVTPAPRVLMDALKAHRRASMFVLPDSLVFCRPDGRQLGWSFVTDRFRKAMEAKGIDWRARNVHPHSFRHSLATILRDADYSAEKTRAAMGWSTEIMQRKYEHLAPEHLAGQAEIVDRLF